MQENEQNGDQLFLTKSLLQTFFFTIVNGLAEIESPVAPRKLILRFAAVLAGREFLS
jgi:hypothetical protein